MDQNFLYSMGLGMNTAKTDWAAALGAQTVIKNLTTGDSEFQKLLERAQNPQDVELPQKPQTTHDPKEQPKTESKTETKTESKPETEEENPLELSNRASLLVSLAPMTQEELSQIPQELLPQVGEGEGIVCTGMTAGPDGESVPILMGENAAAAQYSTAAYYNMDAQPQPVQEAQAEEILTQAPVQTQQEQIPVQAEQASVEIAPDPQPQAEVKAEVQTEAETQPQTRKEEEVQVVQADTQPHALFHDVEAAPVKVGETYAPDQTAETQDVGAQIGSQLSQAIEQGASRVEIQLTPESLGRVTVEITQTPDGMLHIALSAERSETHGLLEKHAANLQMLLGRNQQEPIQVEVQRQEESQQNHNQHNPYDGQNGGQQGQQQERRRQQHPQQSQDFMHQLRLGLIPMETSTL